MSKGPRALLTEQVAAWNRGDIDGYCAWCSDDVVYITQGGVVRGREALRDTMRARYPDRAAMGTLTLEVDSEDRAGDTTIVVVRWSIGPRGGVAMVVLQNGAEGWRMTHDATFALG